MSEALRSAQRHMVHAHTFCSQCVKHAADLDDIATATPPPVELVEALLATFTDRFHEARAGTPEWRDGIRLGLQIAMNEVGYWAATLPPEPARHDEEVERLDRPGNRADGTRVSAARRKTQTEEGRP